MEGEPLRRSIFACASKDSNFFVFGGRSNGALLGSLQVFNVDEGVWSNISYPSENSPTRRWGSRLILEGGLLYLFGGASNPAVTDFLNDLHGFDPSLRTWTDFTSAVSGSPPSPRAVYGFASVRGKLYVHGGMGYNSNNRSDLLNDLHVLNPSPLIWTDLSSAVIGTPPSGRFGHGFASVGEKLFVHGGLGYTSDGSQVVLNDLHVFDPSSSTWTDLSTSVSGFAPSPRASHGFASIGEKLYVHGGTSYANSGPQGYLKDLHVYDPSLRTWNDLTSTISRAPPSRRAGHGFVQIGQKLYVHGGDGYTSNGQLVALNDLIVLDPSSSTWTDLSSIVSGTPPLRRYNHGFASCGGKIYVHGGDGYTNTGSLVYLNSLNVWDPSLRTWTDLSSNVSGTSPSRRSSHGFASVGDKLYLFGGYGYKSDGQLDFLNDLFVYDPPSLTWTDLSSAVNGTLPSRRSGLGFASVGGKIYLHGGYGYTSSGSKDLLNDLFVLDPSSLNWTNLSSAVNGTLPSRRNDHGFASVGETLFVHGGYGYTSDGHIGVLKDLFTFDPSSITWTDLSSAVSGSPPSSRAAHGFAQARGLLFVHGGFEITVEGLRDYRNDFFVLDPSSKIWTDLSAVVGSPPSRRGGHGFASVGEKLYVHAGYGYFSDSIRVYLDDMFFIKPPREWIWTGEGLVQLFFIFDWDIIVLTPNASLFLPHPLILCAQYLPCALRVEGQGGSILRTGPGALVCLTSNGCTSVSLSAVQVTCSHSADAPLNSLLQADGSRLDLTQVDFDGCRSQNDGAVVLSYGGALVRMRGCSARSCWSASRGGVVAVFGSSLNIVNSSFVNVSSALGGGCVWAGAFQSCFGENRQFNSSLSVVGCKFVGCTSGGSGGALLATSESADAGEQVRVEVLDSHFENAMATVDGGAISAIGGLIQLTVFNCTFSSCLATFGGGVSALLDSRVQVVGSEFSQCSAVQGGGLSAANGSKLHISSSSFAECTSEAGGAINVEYEAQVALIECNFSNNAASKLGGGAVYLSQARFLYGDCKFHGNSAPLGGGGVFLWQGYVDIPDAFECPSGTSANPEKSPQRKGPLSSWVRCLPNKDIERNGSNYEISTTNGTNTSSHESTNGREGSSHEPFNSSEEISICDQSNMAAYGECVASGFWSLDLEGLPSASAPAWAGLEFSMQAVKKDVYGQTIVDDSSTVLEVTSWANSSEHNTSLVIVGDSFARLDLGVATFSVIVKLVFDKVDFATSQAVVAGVPAILVQGNDNGAQLKSLVHPLSLRDGAAVCPPGYILALDLALSHGRLGGPGACQRCQGGTYSVHPLAPNPALPSLAPACLNCPAGVDCSRGGNETTFEAGRWATRRGMLVLEGCPPGHQLVNSTAGTSLGSFWHDGQQCRPCFPGQYIIDPDRDLCQNCPPGANCSGGIAPKVAGSTWTVTAGVWTLVGCPAGHYLGESQCLTCPAGSYCIGGSAGPTPCGVDRFARPAAPTSALCAAAVFVSITVSLPVGREALTAARQTALMGSLAHAAGGVDPQDLSLSGIVQADLLVEVSVRIACPNAAAASITAESIGQQGAISKYLGMAEFEGAELVRVEQTACVAGEYLGSAKKCFLCPASFYCPGGSAGSQACASGSFSQPGSSTPSACFASLFVSLRISLLMDSQFFNDSIAARLRQAVADTSKVSADQVVLNDVPAVYLKGARRQPAEGKSAFSTTHGSGNRSVGQNQLNSFVGLELTQAIDKSTSERDCASICSNQNESQPLQQHSQAIRLQHSQILRKVQQEHLQALQKLEVAQQQVHMLQMQLHEHWQARFGPPATPNPSMDYGVSAVYSGASRRANVPTTGLTAQIAVPTAAQAHAVAGRLTPDALGAHLAAKGLPPASILSVTVLGDSSANADQDGTPVPLVVGLVLGMVALLVGLRYALRVLWRHRWHQSFVRVIASSKAGGPASAQHLPLSLARHFVPEAILGKGVFGCVVQAMLKDTETRVAIKLVVPRQQAFKEYELLQLGREKQMLEMLTRKHEAHAVRLVDSVMLAAGLKAACVTPSVSWFVMELLEGETLGQVVEREAVNDKECIQTARDVLACLKVLHAEGVMHRDVKPDNIVRCPIKAGRGKEGREAGEYVYKLIDFGTAAGVDEEVAKKDKMTLTEQRNMDQGTLPYMSPEMFTHPDQASYPADLWSLGVTLFQLATRQLPFVAETDHLFGLVVADMQAKAPSLLDRLDDYGRKCFDVQLARVVAKALEKHVTDRFASANEMHEAVFSCLILRGEAFYSVFISYRALSDAPLAHLLFDELNHSVTPAGHRVTVCWDSFRHDKDDSGVWEKGMADGLLRSLVFLPLLSYGATAPMAALPDAFRAELVVAGWDEQPIGLERLKGQESDPEDGMLKELLAAASILYLLPPHASYQPVLQAAYPMLVGRQEPEGHPSYPRMGSFDDVQGGKGAYPKLSSLPTSRAVAAFLRDKAGLGEAVVAGVLEQSVAWAVESLTQLPGCQLWSHAADLQEADLTKEQARLVGKGCTGPAVDFGEFVLSERQREMCRKGLDTRQLRMLKAQVRSKLGDIHNVIDRAMDRSGPESRVRKGSGMERAELRSGVGSGGVMRGEFVLARGHTHKGLGSWR